jgi:transposase-like protein
VDPKDRGHSIKLEDGKEKWICTVCEKHFNSAKNMHAHYRKMHMNYRAYKCEDCGKELTTAEAYTNHIESVHKGNGAYKTKFKCDSCVKGYSKQVDLDRHQMFAHGAPRNILCEICGNGFVRTSHLDLHKKAVHYKI